ncbi:MAG: hypothetical protein V1839_03485 [archaeon]
MFGLGKKGQGMHMFGGMDLVIILIGVIIGLAAIYFLKDNSFVQNLICSAAPAAAAP